MIGDKIELNLVATVSGANSVAFPSLDTLFSKYRQIEVLNVGDTEIKTVNQSLTFEKTLLITIWEPGVFVIPSLTFSYVPENEPVTFFTDEISLFAIAPQITGDSLYVADIKGLMEEVPGLWDHLISFISHPLVILFLLLLLLIAGFFVFKYFMNNRKSERIFSPEQIALKRLENLRESNYLAENDFQSYHAKISFILRSYINGRFEIAALEQPLNRFIPLVEEHPLMKNDIFEELTVVLQHANLIKFAKASPLNIANEKAFAFCFELLNSIEDQLITET